MNYKIQRAGERGGADYGWLRPNYSFSFSNYFNPERMGFGTLRVLNDDWIAGNQGFGTHPHDNMEIITIPFSGSLHHKDSMGNEGVIVPNQIQVMSAGTGITHSEWNPSDEACTLFQIWIEPKTRSVEPRYDQAHFNPETMLNRFQLLVSPDKDSDGAWVHQDAWISRGKWNESSKVEYTIHKPGNGIFLILIDGDINIQEIKLSIRDSIEIIDEANLSFQIENNADVLLIEVPMK